MESWSACLQRLSAIFHIGRPSNAIWKAETRQPLSTVVIFEDSGNVEPFLNINANVNWRQEKKLDPRRFTYRFLQHVLYQIIRHANEEWFDLIEKSSSHITGLEDRIYGNPEDDAWGNDLWLCSRHWLLFDRVLSLHLRMLPYLQAQAAKFLVHSQNRLGLNIEREDVSNVFHRNPLSFKKHQIQVTQALINPTTNLLDMIYKRVAIRDARYSLQLNESLWRLSWITFIFLPLTFVAGLFGMNIDLFAGNPSIKWYFVVAIPLVSRVDP
ncbi:cora-like Mg2+ transporter protein-domain-containing protein [Pseudomassariella vexata]|uniref:Cora-like Mg2+ transporter protein-domain-containing protein n=1 Tax=Pseudomassariella vexata TaxID=1141098 RepID=A0A1Y2DBD3_9PEZI|nr:cora-like Mg2+ transporter protein-domain-containing protein [Pseudomassariella vexata]ORY56583.1 cora-like Mg2+ transporter protein-domain-containing protein [Pseudomassariella vexata]